MEKYTIVGTLASATYNNSGAEQGGKDRVNLVIEFNINKKDGTSQKISRKMTMWNNGNADPLNKALQSIGSIVQVEGSFQAKLFTTQDTKETKAYNEYNAYRLDVLYTPSSAQPQAQAPFFNANQQAFGGVQQPQQQMQMQLPQQQQMQLPQQQAFEIPQQQAAVPPMQGNFVAQPQQQVQAQIPGIAQQPVNNPLHEIK